MKKMPSSEHPQLILFTEMKSPVLIAMLVGCLLAAGGVIAKSISICFIKPISFSLMIVCCTHSLGHNQHVFSPYDISRGKRLIYFPIR